MPGRIISINARQRTIIYALLNSEGRLTLSTLAKLTGLSPRIIRYNLDIVRAWFRNERVQLTSRPGYGIEIDAPRTLRKRLLEQISQDNDGSVILTRKQRQRSALFELLNSDSSITYHDLAAVQGFSRSTIIHDVNSMQNWLNSYRLVLRRLPKKGTSITGAEQYRRFALVNLIREELGEKKWYALWSGADLTLIFDKSYLLNVENYLKKLNLEFCCQAVAHIENMIDRELAIYSRIEIMVYLAVTIDALQRGKKPIGPVGFERHDTVEYQVAQVIFSDIARKFQIEIPDQEADLLAVSLLGAKWSDQGLGSASERESVLEQADPNAVRYVNSIISVCARQLHPLLKVDKELAHGLILHLEPVIYRLQYNLPILNDCLEEILEEHAEVYRSARLGVAEMEKELGVPVPPEEIGFLAMYLKAALNRLRIHDRNSHPVVILGDGIRAKTSLLKARLEYELPTLDVIAVFNSYQLDQSILDRAELVLSLIPSEVAGVTCMQVSPFLDPVEKRQIQTWINEQEEKSRKLAFGPHDKPDLVDLLLPQNIQFAASEEDWRAVVSKASQPLIKSGEIEPEYIAGMIKIIEDYGPYMILAPGVIVLHARPVDGVNNVCLSTLILRQPVPFSQEESGQIDIAFVLGAIDDDSHLNALFQLNNLLSQREFTSALRTASKPADVLRAIWSYSSLVDIQ